MIHYSEWIVFGAKVNFVVIEKNTLTDPITMQIQL